MSLDPGTFYPVNRVTHNRLEPYYDIAVPRGERVRLLEGGLRRTTREWVRCYKLRFKGNLSWLPELTISVSVTNSMGVWGDLWEEPLTSDFHTLLFSQRLRRPFESSVLLDLSSPSSSIPISLILYVVYFLVTNVSLFRLP